MLKLEVLADGPWSEANRSNRNWEIGSGLNGPDYDPGTQAIAAKLRDVSCRSLDIVGACFLVTP